MTAFDEIQDRINKRAASLVLPHFIALEQRKHAKNGFKEGCACTYCKTKRQATSDIGHLGRDCINTYRHPFEGALIDKDPWERVAYIRDIIREDRRVKYRARLKELLNDQT